ncbi:Potassium-transporting ATPase ATP-binding subunit [Streptomyces alboniger]
MATLPPFADYAGTHLTMVVLVALLVCLIPTTIGALLSAIGIAGMDRLVQRNVLAMSGRAVEAAGDVSTLLLDKTGTITLGNRQAAQFVPVRGTTEAELADAAQLSSLADETPEGRSIVVLARETYALRERHQGELAGAQWVAFTAQTRMSGVDVGGREIRKGAAGSVVAWVRERGGEVSEDAGALTDRISEAGGTPLLVAVEDTEGARVLGVIHLKDVVKEGMRERFDELRRMGIRTVMITGDNPLTAKAIAQEAGVDDFLAEATPEDKMALIRREQAGGKLVAMTGDGTNDAPALAQADVGVAMNTGTSAAKEAGNMVDLDSNPTKLIEIVEIGKQLLITRGALTTFSIANDVGEVLRDHPGAVRGGLPGPGQAEHHAPGLARLRDPLCGRLQRADHHRAGAAGPAGRAVPPDERRPDAPPQPRDLRHRRTDRPVHRHQDDRPAHLPHPRAVIPRKRVDHHEQLGHEHRPVALSRLCEPSSCSPWSRASSTRSPSPASAQAIFPGKANGSEIKADGRVVGSSLIGQSYDLPLKKGQKTPEPDLKWFQGRPRNGLGTNSVNTRYKLILSGATNRSGDDKDLIAWVTAAKKAVVKDNSVNGYTGQALRRTRRRGDLLRLPAWTPTSPRRTLGRQVHRIAERNGLSVAQVRKLVDEHTDGRTPRLHRRTTGQRPRTQHRAQGPCGEELRLTWTMRVSRSWAPGVRSSPRAGSHRTPGLRVAPRGRSPALIDAPDRRRVGSHR